MGQLIDGRWIVDAADKPKDSDGVYRRRPSVWRDTVEDTPGARFPVEQGRYHLYVAWACPWAHRTLLARKLLGLEAALPVSVVAPDMLDQGWVFDDAHPDALYGLGRLYELYQRDDPEATTRVTVPVLWDAVQQRIVNNESSELIRMFSGPFRRLQRPDALLAGHELRPPELVEELDAVNDRIYTTLNNGVYKAGFARTQAAYDAAVGELFDTLDWLEQRLQDRRWLVGDRITEADLRLFPTLLRFDLVYHHHFKCSRSRLRDLPALWAYTRDIFQLPGVRDTLNIGETRRHYFCSHESINPQRILPICPAVDFDEPHARAQLGGLKGRPSATAQRAAG